MGPPGTVLGHEIAGTIDSLGAGVDNWRIGRPVAVRPFTGVRHLPLVPDRPGRPLRVPSSSSASNGPAASPSWWRATPESLRCPPPVTGPDQALVEPLAVARHTMRRTGDVTRQTVVVLGAGPIGLGVTAWAHRLRSDPRRGERPVRRASRDRGDPRSRPHHRSLRDDVGAAIREHTGDPADAVVECSGRPGLIKEAMQLANIEGRVTVVGICMTPDTVLPWFGLSELDVRFSIYYGREDFTDTLGALAAGSLPVAGLVSEVISLEELPDRFGAYSANIPTPARSSSHRDRSATTRRRSTHARAVLAFLPSDLRGRRQCVVRRSPNSASRLGRTASTSRLPSSITDTRPGGAGERPKRRRRPLNRWTRPHFGEWWSRRFRRT